MFRWVILFSVLHVLALSACTRLPSIKLGKSTITGNRDAGTPATVSSNDSTSTLNIPAGTKVVTAVTAPTPATSTTPYVPSLTRTEWTFSSPTTFESTAAALLASTGTIDTSVAKHRIDVAERRWLLWAGIACGIAGLVVKSLLPTWPSLSNGLLFAAPCALAAWKFSEIPAWLWFIAIAVVVFLALGYKRAEWDANGDGIPDTLQTTKK